jgi:hypothetical protein
MGHVAFEGHLRTGDGLAGLARQSDGKSIAASARRLRIANEHEAHIICGAGRPGTARREKNGERQHHKKWPAGLFFKNREHNSP